MALDVNFNNAQFNQFVQFAQQAGKATTIAKMGEEVQGGGPLAGRTIVAKSGDSIGNVGRLKTSRNVNNEVRALFKQTIADMFGGEDRIPDSVKDAMKMADFGKGKPLTARRILAVKAAVDQIAEKAQTSIAECKGKFGGKRAPQAHALLEPAFDACGTNPDAMDIVKANITKLVYTGASDFCTAEQIRKKVGDMVANLNELKAESGNDPGLYAAGKEMLKYLGKALPAGTFAKMIEAVRGISVGDVGKLSGSSSGKSIHKAVMQFYKSLNAAMVSSGADKLLQGDVQDLMSARTFMTAAALSGFGKGVLAKIGAALNSNTAANLVGFYAKCASDDNPYAQNESADVRKGLNDVGNIGETYLRMLNDGVNLNMQRLSPGAGRLSLPADVGEVNLRAIGGDGFVAEAVSSAKDVNAANVQAYADATVEGGGKGAEVMKKIIKDKLDVSNDPAGKMRERLNANANAMMNWNICGEMKKLAAGDGAQFKKDIDRGTNATLTDGKTTIKLTRDFETARNELAQFVTGDPKATYASLETKPAEKAKVHLLMALIGQETEKAGENGSSYALDKRETEDSFTLTGFKEKDRQALRTYTIQKLDDGGIALHYVMDKPIKEIDDGTTDGDGYALGEGSKFTCKIDYTLNGTEVNRLAKLDYSKFDDEQGYQIFNRKVDMPDGSRQFQANKLEKVVDTFAEEFKVKADCHMDFMMRLNPTDDEQANMAPLQGGNVIINP